MEDTRQAPLGAHWRGAGLPAWVPPLMMMFSPPAMAASRDARRRRVEGAQSHQSVEGVRPQHELADVDPDQRRQVVAGITTCSRETQATCAQGSVDGTGPARPVRLAT